MKPARAITEELSLANARPSIPQVIIISKKNDDELQDNLNPQAQEFCGHWNYHLENKIPLCY